MSRPDQQRLLAGFAAGALWGTALIAATAEANPPDALPPVREDYVLHCSACHGPNGKGVSGVVPGLDAVGDIISRPGGRDYLMRVPGAAQAPLDDARLARLLGWVVEQFGRVTAEPAFTAAEVGVARRTPLRDPAAARRALFD